MLKANNGKDSLLAIELFKFKRIIPPNKLIHNIMDKKFYHGLI